MSNVFVIIKMCYVHNQWYDISCTTLYYVRWQKTTTLLKWKNLYLGNNAVAMVPHVQNYNAPSPYRPQKYSNWALVLRDAYLKREVQPEYAKIQYYDCSINHLESWSTLYLQLIHCSWLVKRPWKGSWPFNLASCQWLLASRSDIAARSLTPVGCCWTASDWPSAWPFSIASDKEHSYNEILNLYCDIYCDHSTTYKDYCLLECSRRTWRWGLYLPPKYQNLPTTVHSITSQNTMDFTQLNEWNKQYVNICANDAIKFYVINTIIK